MRTSRLVVVAVAVVLLAGVLPALARPQAPPAPNSVQGQLVRVDAAAKTITIRTETDTQIMFTYNDETKVTGSEDDPAGLATMSGTDVKVEYIKRGQENVATLIEVLKKPAV